MSEVFEGHSSEMKTDSPWLSSEDILGKGDVNVTIEKCFRHRDVEFDAGRKKAVVYSLKFSGANKQLVLNSTNRKTLVRLFGPDVKEWAGKKVTLWVDNNVRLGKETVSGVRIK